MLTLTLTSVFLVREGNFCSSRTRKKTTENTNQMYMRAETSVWKDKPITWEEFGGYIAFSHCWLLLTHFPWSYLFDRRAPRGHAGALKLTWSGCVYVLQCLMSDGEQQQWQIQRWAEGQVLQRWTTRRERGTSQHPARQHRGRRPFPERRYKGIITSVYRWLYVVKSDSLVITPLVPHFALYHYIGLNTMKDHSSVLHVFPHYLWIACD